MFEWLLPIFGFLISIAASLTGIGGGTFVVPLLALLYNFEPVVAIGTSTATIVITSIMSAISYLRQGRVYVKAGLVLACATAPGAYLGAVITAVPAVKMWLGVIFGILLIYVAFQMVYKAFSTKSVRGCGVADPVFERELLKNWKKMLRGLCLSFLGGIASGMLGIGGGVVLVPVMCYALSIPIYFAIPTSMFIMIFTSISGAASHIQQGNVNGIYAIYLGVGAVVGAYVGAYISKKFSSKGLSLAFAAMLLVASINMIMKNLQYV